MTDREDQERWTTPEGQQQLEHILACSLGTNPHPDSLRARSLLRRVNDKIDLRFAPLANRTLSRIDLSTTDLTGADLQGVQAVNATFLGAELSHSKWSGANLKGAILDEVTGSNVKMDNADLSGCKLRRIHLENATFEKSRLPAAALDHAALPHVNLRDTTLVGADLSRATINQDSSLCRARCEGAHFADAIIGAANLEGANLRGANLARARLMEVNLTDAILAEADLESAEFTDVIWRRTDLSRSNLKGITVRSRSPLTDGSESIVSKGNRLLNWARLRTIGEVPLFGVSWTAFLLSLSCIHLVGWLNEQQILLGINYPIPIPGRLPMILLNSVILVIGTTIYRFWCPHRVQEFSETRWVEEHRHPRLLYFQASWSRRPAQWLAFLFTAAGGLIAAVLIGERILVAMRYILKWSLQVGTV